jgi:hypothetical protein
MIAGGPGESVLTGIPAPRQGSFSARSPALGAPREQGEQHPHGD